MKRFSIKLHRNTKKHYQKVDTDTNYNTDNLQPTMRNNKNKDGEKRNITWFNPPFNSQVKTKIGNKFLSIINESRFSSRKTIISPTVWVILNMFLVGGIVPKVFAEMKTYTIHWP
jgi:hypothetical protein